MSTLLIVKFVTLEDTDAITSDNMLISYDEIVFDNVITHDDDILLDDLCAWNVA
jgi:hypothetical protein